MENRLVRVVTENELIVVKRGNEGVYVFSRCAFQGMCEHMMFDHRKNGEVAINKFREGYENLNECRKVDVDSEQSVSLMDKIQVTFRTDSQTGLVTVKAVGLNDLANDPTLPIDISIGMFEYIPGVKDDGTPYPNYGNMQNNGKFIFAADNNGALIRPDSDSTYLTQSQSKDSLVIKQTFYDSNTTMEIVYLAKAGPSQRFSVKYYFEVLRLLLVITMLCVTSLDSTQGHEV